jgi:hypothetical protein
MGVAFGLAMDSSQGLALGIAVGAGLGVVAGAAWDSAHSHGH